MGQTVPRAPRPHLERTLGGPVEYVEALADLALYRVDPRFAIEVASDAGRRLFDIIGRERIRRLREEAYDDGRPV